METEQAQAPESQSFAEHFAAMNAKGAKGQEVQYGQTVEHLDNHVTLDTLDAALKDFKLRANPAGEVNLFIENVIVLGSKDGSKPTQVIGVVSSHQLKQGEGDKATEVTVTELHPIVMRACSKYSVSAEVKAVMSDGAQVCFKK